MSTQVLKLFVLAALVVGTLAVGNSRYQQVQAEQPPCPSTLPSASSPTPPSGGTVQIVGPTEGTPGQTLTVKLMNGTTQLSVDRWEQVLNPDLYTGTDYVTSFCLNMQPQQDGSLQITAPAPGRYKLAAIRGSERWETYVLIRPQTVSPAIRGAAFYNWGPVDRAYAPRLLALAKKAGMTWAELPQAGVIDFDSNSLAIQNPCTSCGVLNSLSLADYRWVIDEAHRQGFKVVVEPQVWAKYSGPVNPNYLGVYARSDNLYELEPVLRTLKDQNPTIVDQVMQTYVPFITQMAQLAQQHQAEAMILGDSINDPDDPLLWSETTQWTTLLAQLRQIFTGKL